jgi:hypothetical protein
MFPFIQCHHTRGRALFGGFSNPLLSGSAGVCATAATAPSNSSKTAETSFADKHFVVAPSFPIISLRSNRPEELPTARVAWFTAAGFTGTEDHSTQKNPVAENCALKQFPDARKLSTLPWLILFVAWNSSQHFVSLRRAVVQAALSHLKKENATYAMPSLRVCWTFLRSLER